jgi:hypothetical protein
MRAKHGTAPTHQIFATKKDRADMHEMPGSRLCSFSDFLKEFTSLAQLGR